jgi:putative membrane protein
MRSFLFPAAALSLLTFCTPGNNRQTGETGMAGGAGGQSSSDTMASSSSTMSSANSSSAAADTATNNATSPTTPAAILSQLSMANTMEIQLSKMAQKKASSPKVKQVAARLLADHSKNESQLKALAKQLNVTLTPSAGGNPTAADSAAMPSELQGKSGAQFDQAFVQHEIDDHQSNIQKIQSQMLPSAQNAQVKSYLQKTVTAMQGHLASLQQAQKQLSSS